jgi:hypothetical protein
VIKARNRKLSLILVLAMLMTMFAGLGTASAADMYAVSSVQSVTDGTGQKLGTIVVTATNLEVGQQEAFVLKLPADFAIEKIGAKTVAQDVYGILGIAIDLETITASKIEPTSASATIKAFSTGQANRIKVVVVPLANIEELRFNLGLTAKVPSGAPSDVYATLVKEPGSLFADGAVLVATTGAGAIEVLANDPVSFGSASKDVSISVRVNTNDAFKSLSLKLPAGFEWDGKPALVNPGIGNVASNDLSDSGRTAKFESTTANPVTKGLWTVKGKVKVDESRAKFGDVVVSLSGNNVKPASVTIGSYSDYGIEVEASDVPTVLAGRTEVEIADISIEELAAGSLVDGRSVYLTLPGGVRWVFDSNNVLKTGDIKNSGSAKPNGDITVYSNKKEMAKLVIDNSATSKSKGNITIKDAQVEIAPDYVGDIVVKVSGSAGVEGEVKVGEVLAPITVEADVTDIIIGSQAQAGGNIMITEAKAEALETTGPGVDSSGKAISNAEGYLTLTAPEGVKWAKVPTVEVVEGDVEIGDVTRTNNNRTLSFRIKESSTVASKIEVSDISWTVDRTVPEGDMKVTVAGNSVVKAVFTNRTSVTSFVAASVVTPAPGETVGNGEFKIGSNIYYVGGVAKVMDVAPYIKGDRTYVPMRYLGEILGAEVVWDDAARTVTLTKGDTTVVFTIGSTTYTVNGEAKTADVAPEIANDRTMLPARFVAEAFGATVGWDAATQTVLIQQ